MMSTTFCVLSAIILGSLFSEVLHLTRPYGATERIGHRTHLRGRSLMKIYLCKWIFDLAKTHRQHKCNYQISIPVPYTNKILNFIILKTLAVISVDYFAGRLRIVCCSSSLNFGADIQLQIDSYVVFACWLDSQFQSLHAGSSELCSSIQSTIVLKIIK